MRQFLLLLALALIAAQASAVRVGVIVEFESGGVFTKCVEAMENADAYEVLQASGLPVTWKEYADKSHTPCQILDTGCAKTDCKCTREFWNLHVKRRGAWNTSDAGFDNPGGCEEHYCARQGDVIGLTFDAYGRQPQDYSYAEVCPRPPKPQEKPEPDVIGNMLSYPAKNAGFITAGILILVLVGYFVYRPWRYI